MPRIGPHGTVTLALLLALTLGCGAEPGPGEDTIKLMQLVDLRRQFVELHEGAEPESADALREWLTTAPGQQELELRGITDLDNLFTSSRDGEPFVMVAQSEGALTNDENRIVAYEQKGIDQKRLVAFDLGQVEEMEASMLVHLQAAHVPSH